MLYSVLFVLDLGLPSMNSRSGVQEVGSTYADYGVLLHTGRANIRIHCPHCKLGLCYRNASPWTFRNSRVNRTSCSGGNGWPDKIQKIRFSLPARILRIWLTRFRSRADARLCEILAAPTRMTVSTKPARATPSTRSGGKVEARGGSSRYHPGLVGRDSH